MNASSPASPPFREALRVTLTRTLAFLNGIRPRLPRARGVQRIAHIAVWFGGGVLLTIGAKLTARALLGRTLFEHLSLASAGALFVAIELIAHAALRARGRSSFYDSLVTAHE